ncbi:hypothetical protein CXF85_22505 [Colwellia sp. 75C3]|uniref:hypothetical protein n=1 Tax=Colwellia sp. 75C3 TaxID=888425 RepID=UPI000C32053F|nr:hypothetical protein [Colwellia sp. 75C3]PKG80877.1 hypothetical protein CXF85_22505 [Colwellia sp. 75C3]
MFKLFNILGMLIAMLTSTASFADWKIEIENHRPDKVKVKWYCYSPSDDTWDNKDVDKVSAFSTQNEVINTAKCKEKNLYLKFQYKSGDKYMDSQTQVVHGSFEVNYSTNLDNIWSSATNIVTLGRDDMVTGIRVPWAWYKTNGKACVLVDVLGTVRKRDKNC